MKNVRLRMAAYMLVHNKVNVSEVAYRVGFSTHSYFSSAFREMFGLTPKDFVAAHTDDLDDETFRKLIE